MSAAETALMLAEPMGQYLYKVVLGSARILACMAWLPALDASIMPSRMTRMALACVIFVGLWPEAVMPPHGSYIEFSANFVFEVLVGLSMGLALSLPFHVFHGIGALLDNQRGATISSAIDPFNGIDSSETSSLLHMLCAAVFLSSGGLLHILKGLQDSFQFIPLGTAPDFNMSAIASLMGSLLGHSLRMAAPVVLLLFLLEGFLGILSRFAQQMNAFAVALALKSFVAFLGLLLMLRQIIHTELPSLFDLAPLRMLRLGIQ